MPVYNAENYVKEAIDSILSQSYSNFELIIIDDCSTDKSMDIVNQYKDDRIIIIHNSKNSGIAYSRNIGLENSSGKYIAIMDDDDISTSIRFEKQVDFLENNKNIDILGGGVQLIDLNGNVMQEINYIYINPKYIKALFLFKNVYCNSEVMFRRDFIIKNNIRYDDNCLGLEDFSFWINCSKLGSMTNLKELLLKHRKSEVSETHRVLREQGMERKKLYTELQRISFEKSGFRLEDKHFCILSKLIAEHDGYCETREELSKFHEALREVVSQSRRLNLDNSEEIEIMCKKFFLSQLKHFSDFWEISY